MSDSSLSDAGSFGRAIGERTRKIARETAAEVAGDLVRAALPSDSETYARQDAALRSQARTVLAEQFGAQLGNEELARQQADLDVAARIEAARAELAALADAQAALTAHGEALARLADAIAGLSTEASAARGAAASAQARADEAVAMATPAPLPKGAIAIGAFFGRHDQSRAYPAGATVIGPTGSQFIARKQVPAKTRLPTSPKEADNPKGFWAASAENTTAAFPTTGAAPAICGWSMGRATPSPNIASSGWTPKP